MDIPTYRGSTIKSSLIGIGWMITVLFSPELLLCIAFTQRMNASAVLRGAFESGFAPANRVKSGAKNESEV